MRGRGFEPQRPHCIVLFEQDTFILAKYWFNPGRPGPTHKQKRDPNIWVCSILTLCLLGNFHAFLSSADFFQNQLFRKFYQESHQSVKQFGSRSGLTLHFVGPDLDPNCLQRLLADDTSGQTLQRVKRPWFCCVYNIVSLMLKPLAWKFTRHAKS